jgi:hypothetical protein
MATELTEQKIQRRLNGFFASWKYNVDGLYVFGWESDKLIWTKAGYIYEFEVKISRADYMNDFKHKVEKHLLLNSALPDEKTEARQADLFGNLFTQKRKRYPQITMEQAKQFMKPVGERMPNYFYYAVPDGMLEADEVPPYAGLIYIHEDKGFSIIREAPRLHTTKYTDGELNLGEKFYYNMKTWQKNYREQVEYSLMYRERLQHELDSKNQDKSYKELQDELEKAKGSIKCWQEDSQKYYGLYITMVEGADYNTIERRLLLNELKAHGVDVEKRYSEIMEEAENLYQQRYPSRHREKQEQQ